MNIMPNPLLVALQLFPFIVTSASLYFIILKPMMEYLEERENRSFGATDSAKSLESETAAMKEQIDARLQAAQKQASDKRAQARQELVAQYNTYVHEQRQIAEQKIQDAAREMEVEKAAAKQAIRAQAEGFATDIASKLIGRDVA